MGQTTQPNNSLSHLSDLGAKVTVRTTSWLDLCMRAWGAEWSAPDHKVYQFSNGREFDSTDQSNMGLYGR